MKYHRHMVHGGSALLLCAGLSVAPHAQADCNYEPTIGQICTFAFDFCPVNYLEANGAVLSISSNTALFSLLGTTYGGDGRTTFALPDYRGRAIIGAGGGPDLPPEALMVNLGEKVGAPSVTLSTDQMPFHNHPATFSPSTGTTEVSMPATSGDLAVNASLNVSSALGDSTALTGTGYLAGITPRIGTTALKGPYTTTPPIGSAAVPLTVQTSGTPNIPTRLATVPVMIGGTVAVQGQNTAAQTAVPTQSPALGVKVCIATRGFFPSRPY